LSGERQALEKVAVALLVVYRLDAFWAVELRAWLWSRFGAEVNMLAKINAKLVIPLNEKVVA
jgi:hypothetical protein